MKLLIIHAHNNNRGDEAAVRAMVDEILNKYPDIEIVISNNGATPYPNMPKKVEQIARFPKPHSKIAQLEWFITILTKGKVTFTDEGKKFINHLKSSDLVIHAPGGPSIGDIYYKAEWLYLWRLNLVHKLKIPYMFYAPSMGPFEKKSSNKLRKKVLSGAERIILRDPISLNYVKKFVPNQNIELAIDSALQHDIQEQYVQDVFNNYKPLQKFLKEHDKVIGITITDLRWHPKHKLNPSIENIEIVFQKFIDFLVGQGYGVIFIPQLYGEDNDTIIMNEYMRENHTFMVDAFKEQYDAYFQQYLIGKIFGVVGMRYHSNIFSAKMGTPFVSVSYEQKMKGFMRSISLSDYCIDINDLSIENLKEKFDMLENNYSYYKSVLKDKHNFMKNESHKSTDIVFEILERKNLNQ